LSLKTKNEWLALDFKGGRITGFGPPADEPDDTPINEITSEENERIFRPFAVAVSGPGLDQLAACETVTYEYTVLNKGALPDDYQVTLTDPQGFAGGSRAFDIPTLEGGAPAAFTVEVSIPEGTPAGTEERIGIAVQSSSAERSWVRDAMETLIRVTGEDGDGIPSCDDECPRSDLSPTIAIAGCDSGVRNQLFAGGCSMADRIAACIRKSQGEEAARRKHDKDGKHEKPAEREKHLKHEQLKKARECIQELLKDWKKRKLIDGKERERIEKCLSHLEKQ